MFGANRSQQYTSLQTDAEHQEAMMSSEEQVSRERQATVPMPTCALHARGSPSPPAPPASHAPRRRSRPARVCRHDANHVCSSPPCVCVP